MHNSLSKALLCFLPLVAEAASFLPESGGLLSSVSVLPLQFDIAGSQTESLSITGSFWQSSFIHGSNNHDYMLVTHALPDLPGTSVYRASLLDITNTSRYDFFAKFSNNTNFFSSETGVFNVSYPDFGFGSTSTADGVSKLRSWSTVSGVEFDVTFEMSSPVLLNGGLGVFDVSSNTTTYEWGMPAGKTTGWLLVDGSEVAVDTANSLTWYDRQWLGIPASWTWFEIHLDNGNIGEDHIVMSVWIMPEVTGDKQFATVREGGAGIQTVVPVSSLQASNRTFVSEDTATVYPLDWVLELAEGTKLFLSSVKPNQTFYAQGGTYGGYEGYVTIEGVYKGTCAVTGFGVVEIVSE